MLKIQDLKISPKLYIELKMADFMLLVLFVETFYALLSYRLPNVRLIDET